MTSDQNIYVDFDGTLAEYHEAWNGPLGLPILEMQERVKGWLAEHKNVTIFTARIWPLGTLDEVMPENALHKEAAQSYYEDIQKWCKRYLGRELPVTCVKHHEMQCLYDDRAVQVIKNTGELVQIASTPPVVNKVTKVGAGYIQVAGTDYRCKDCWKWIPKSERCAELGPQDRVRVNGYCTLWSYGNPVKGLVPKGSWTPEEVGYGELANGTMCKRCEYFLDTQRACEKVQGKIAPNGCCNNQEPDEDNEA